MTFSYAKKHTLSPVKERKTATFFLAILIATAFFIPYILEGNGYFIFYGDFNVQQIPFYRMCHDAIRQGNFGWNWSTDLGSAFIPSYSFYTLGSPFFWLTLPFPSEIVPYLMGPLLILKFGCAALTAYLFIRRFTHTPFAAQLGALLYAFSGFSIYNIFFNHFHEAIIIFPLLLLSLELLVTENKRGYFAITVALSALINYFFFFGMVIFTIIYWFIRIISGAYKFKFSRFASIIIEAVIGVALAAVLLLPSLKMVMGNSRVSNLLIGWSGITYGKEQIYLNIIECFFFPPDIPARPVFFPGADVKWSSLGGWFPVFSMTAVLGFCKSKSGHWIKRLLCVCAVMAFIPFLNSSFYAFNSSYYARWFYMPILIMALATALTIEDKEINWKSGIITTSIITLAFALVVGLFPQKVDGKITLGLYTDAGTNNTLYRDRFVIAVGIALISLLLCFLLYTIRDLNKKLLFRRLAILFVCIITVVYSGIYLGQGSSHSYKKQTVMIDSLIEGNVELEDGNYRIDTFDCVDNTGMYLGYPTINAFHSVVSPSIMEYYNFIGVKRDVASRPSREYFSIRSLLSVKYLLNRADGDSFIGDDGYTLMPGYEYVNTQNNYYIYENTAYIPYGFSYDYYITQKECEAFYTDTARADVMLKAIILSDEDALKYSKYMESYSLYSENYEEEEPMFPEEDYVMPDYYDESFVTDDLVLNPDEEVSSGIDESDVSSDDISDVFEETDDYSDVSDESTETVIPEYVPEEGYKLSLSMSEDELFKDAAHLKESSAISFEINKNGFTATVARENPNLVFFSVPFDEGWTATVNGEKAEIVKANIGFMAVAVPSGVSEIVFTYETPMLDFGIMISIIALAVLILYLIIVYSYKRSHLTEECYPEGKLLLEKWEKEEYLLACSEQEDDLSLLDKMTEPIDLPEENTPAIYDNGFKIDSSLFDEKEEKGIDNNQQ